MSFKFNFKGFEHELAQHFNNEHHIVTEDLIRYWFISAHAEKGNGDPSIEIPYIRDNDNGDSITPLVRKNQPVLNSNNARADLYYGDISKKGCGRKKTVDEEDFVFEFKYHRCTRYSDCCTGTDCGSVFRDLNRLSILDNREKYFVYVFDEKMRKYYDDKISANSDSAFEIFKKLNGEKRQPVEHKVDSNFDKVIFDETNPDKVTRTGFGEINKGAFSQFNVNKDVFNNFNYKVQVLYSNKICDVYVNEFNKNKTADEGKNKSYYLIICQVV